MDDTTKKIIRSLAKHQPRTKIITDLSEYSGLKWDQAELVVNEIEKRHTREIYSRKRPFYILQGSGVALGGFLLAFSTLFASFSGKEIFLPALPIPYLGNFFLALLGILVFAGGIRGVIRIVQG